MGFMEKQITVKSGWYQVETTHGTEWIPDDIRIAKDGLANLKPEDLADYCEGKPLSVEFVRGYGARLSAPGYLDCTEWTVFDTPEEAEAYLEEMYGDDEEDSDDSL